MIRRRRRSRGQLAATVLALSLAAASLGCGRSEPGDDLASTRVPESTPVILVSIDTLRSDRLPAYGYEAGDTPALDTLSEQGILFERAYSHAPTTLPSHASILSGLLPPDHGVRDNLGYSFDGARLPTLPRLLRDAGYRTGGFVSAYVLRSAVGLDAGFDVYDDEIEFRDLQGLGDLQRPGDETLRRAVAWLDSVEREPFFLFFHIYEPHTPYSPPEPFASRFSSAYDGEVAQADRVVGRLVQALQERGLYEPSLIVLLSDHGEGLGDHGEQEHGILLYREDLQVPLMVKLPGSAHAGLRIAEPAQLVDVVPTVLDLLGLERPEGLAGESLLALQGASEPRALYAETFYPRLHFGWSDLASIIRGDHHLISGPDPELYDLAADPAERDNVLRRERRSYAAMRDALAGIDRELQAPGEVDAATRDKLSALGYVGTVGTAPEGPLPDPKARLPVLDDLKHAFELYRDRDLDEAAAAFRDVVAREPGLVDAWEHLGASLEGLGRPEDALSAYEQAMRLSGGAPHIALATATALLELGRYDEAERHARLAVPVHEAGYDLLAQISLERGDLAEAERRVQRALETRGSRLGPLITLSQLRLAQGRLEDAVAATRDVEEAFGDRTDVQSLRGAYYVRGEALARLGHGEEAERAFLREIAINPGYLGAYSHLAVLRALAGRPAEAVAMLRQMVEANATPAAYAEAVRTIRTLGDPNGAAALLREGLRRWPESRVLRELAA